MGITKIERYLLPHTRFQILSPKSGHAIFLDGYAKKSPNKLLSPPKSGPNKKNLKIHIDSEELSPQIDGLLFNKCLCINQVTEAGPK
jgi:hypothetical protein